MLMQVYIIASLTSACTTSATSPKNDIVELASLWPWECLSVNKVVMIIMAVVANNSKPHTPSFCVVDVLHPR